jgi:hypothetical protein
VRFGASELGENVGMRGEGGQAGGHHRRGRRALLPLAATLLAAGAWILLVLLAIELGERARDGDDAAWLLLALTGIAAVSCLVLALLFGRQLLAAVGVVDEYQPRRARR